MPPTPSTFDERIANSIERMSPAEQRVAVFFQENREQVLIASAAALAAKANTSDATIVRTARALGFAGLDDLRRALARELRDSISPADRLTRTLGEVGSSLAVAYDVTKEIHRQSLEGVCRSIKPEDFEIAVRSMIQAQRILVFGLGPSSAIATYLVLQLKRFGLDAASLTNSGLLFADDLRSLRKGDLVVILAYGRVYEELALLLGEIKRQKLGSLLLTDTLAAKLRQQVDQVLPVARGRADMLSMHTATLGLIEALLVGIATQRPTETVASLKTLNDLRKKLVGKAVNLPIPKDDG